MLRIILLASIAFALTATAHPKVEMTGEPTQPPAWAPRPLPDLRPIVTNRAGFPSKLTIAIKNVGAAQAGPSQGQYSCVITGKILQAGIGFFDVPALQPGEQYVHEVSCAPPANTRVTAVCANHAKKITESIYSNNCLSF